MSRKIELRRRAFLRGVGGIMVGLPFLEALAPKAPTDAAKSRRAALWYGASLLLILGGMPWWRPLLRFGA